LALGLTAAPATSLPERIDGPALPNPQSPSDAQSADNERAVAVRPSFQAAPTVSCLMPSMEIATGMVPLLGVARLAPDSRPRLLPPARGCLPAIGEQAACGRPMTDSSSTGWAR